MNKEASDRYSQEEEDIFKRVLRTPSGLILQPDATNFELQLMPRRPEVLSIFVGHMHQKVKNFDFFQSC